MKKKNSRDFSVQNKILSQEDVGCSARIYQYGIEELEYISMPNPTVPISPYRGCFRDVK